MRYVSFDLATIWEARNTFWNPKAEAFLNDLIERADHDNVKKYIKIVTRSCGDEKEVITSIYLLKKMLQKKKCKEC